MIFSKLRIIKYITMILSVIAILPLTHGGALKFMKQTSKSDIPFSNEHGYIDGGAEFTASFTDENGKKFALADFKGNVVIIAFMTSWCPNCSTVQKSLDSLKEYFQNSSKQVPVKILSLYVGNEPLNILKIKDKSNDIQNLETYNPIPPEQVPFLQAVPTCLVFDKDGNPICGYMGARNFFQPQFIEFIEKTAEQ